jgi:hypothetical protein
MQVRCSKASPVLMILDNHESHLSIQVLDFAKDNGVIMLSFPPHCSHMMRPLDRSVFGPFKKYYNTAVKEWLIDHPGKPVSIYDIPGFVAKAFPKAMTPENIMSGFRVTGIFPHNSNVFPKESFLPSAVTDRPMPDPDVTGNQQLLQIAIESADDGTTATTNLTADASNDQAHQSTSKEAAHSVNAPMSGREHEAGWGHIKAEE